jgi:hypothetical protein
LSASYLDHGPEGAFDAVFDEMRKAVLDRKAMGWAVLQSESNAGDDVSLSYELRNVSGRPAMPLRLSVFGVIFYTDPLRRDLVADEINPPFRADVWTFGKTAPGAQRSAA